MKTNNPKEDKETMELSKSIKTSNTLKVLISPETQQIHEITNDTSLCQKMMSGNALFIQKLKDEQSFFSSSNSHAPPDVLQLAKLQLPQDVVYTRHEAIHDLAPPPHTNVPKRTDRPAFSAMLWPVLQLAFG
jgi:hypothetical protein